MLFPTFEFAVFFSLTFVISWLLRPFPLPWRWFILAASYVFYSWWDWRFCFLLAGSTLLNWAAAEVISRAESDRVRRGAVIGAVVANLGVLGFFKYYEFFTRSVTEVLGTIGIDANPRLIEVILPVGISFFTFQALSYVIDMYRRDTESYPLIDFAVYLSFFPHLVAGPIVRARELLPQLQERADPRRIEASLAFRLIFVGLFKKVVISSFLATSVDEVFAVPGQYKSLEILVAIYAYAIQIYADFSGYTDIAIGCALLLGLRFPQNFDAPYSSTSIQEFWRRWHITLSTWLRDYLYIPLGGNQRGERRTMINLFLTMLLGGLWHGAAWTFVAWGAIHGGAQSLERVTGRRRREAGKVDTPAYRVWRWVLTFHIVCLAWVFFRAESFSSAGEILWRLVSAPGSGEIVSPMLLFVIALMIASQFVPTDAVDRVQVRFSRLAPALQGFALGGGLLFIDALGPVGVAPFIYFQF